MSEHPFIIGQRVTCVRAPEPGIPLSEGSEYTVKRTFVGPPDGTEAPITGMESTPGVELVELPDNYFTADRFAHAA